MSYPFDYSAEPFQGFTEFDEFASSDEFDEFGVFGEGEFDEFDEFGEEEFGEPEVFGYGFETEEERGGMRRVPGRARVSSGRPPRGRPPAGRPLRARPPRASRPLPPGRRPVARPRRPGTKPPGRPPGRPRPPRPRPRYPWPIYKPWPGVFPVEAYPQVGRFGNWFRSGDQLILLLDEDATPLAGGAEGAGAPAPAPNGGAPGEPDGSAPGEPNGAAPGGTNGGAPAGSDAGAPSEPGAGAQAEPTEGAEGELYGAGRRPSWRVRRLLRRVAPRTRWAATNQEFNFEVDPLRALAEYGGAFGQFGGGGGERETTAAGKSPSRAPAATPVGPFGTLVANAPGRKPFQYGFTAEDVLWTARFLVGEAGGRDNLDNQAVIWAMLNRYALFTHRYYPTFHRFIRAYSTPLQPVLKSSGAAKRHMHKPEFVRTGGTYEGTDIPRGQLARFLKLQQTPWGKLPASARSLAERALKGQVANPIGNASEFASTRVYFRDRYKRWPRDFEEWRRFTESFAAGKKWVWVGPVAGIDPMNNTFFVQKSVAQLAPGTVRVVAGSPSVRQGGGTNQEAGGGGQQFYYGAPYESESGAGWQGEVNRRSRDYIRWVQSSLNRLLSLQLAVDGQSGAQTRSAVRSFQQRAGLTADGDVGPQTEAALVRAGAPPPPGAGATTQTPSGMGGASGGQASGARPPAPTGPSSGLPGVVSAPCGVRTTKPATDRCTGPVLPTCPPVPDLLCVTSVSGIPFEYVMNSGWVVKGAGGLYVVKNRSARKQNFTPAVAGAVARFISNMASIGMPVEAILTGGSYYCRCISHTNTLSNHSFGDAIDVAGIRWRSPTGSRETIVHNYANPGERAILRRINACLRLSFANVIDYHRTDHRDHFHCDTNRGKGRYPKGSTSVVFIKEALNKIMGLGIPETTAYDAATAKGLRDFSGRTADELSNTATLNKVLDDLFARVARG